MEALDRALARTLKCTNEKLGNDVEPTVLWSGNGYHIYLPIQAFILEGESIFAEFEQPSRKFIQFAEQFLSNKKADPCHSNCLSFRNCMLRVPGSYNSKLVKFSDTEETVRTMPSETEVRIIQTCNGVRPVIKPLLADFYIYLADTKIREIKQRGQAERKRARWHSSHPNQRTETTKWLWIEILLQTPIRDYRKNTARLILAPYLINIRKISYEESFNVIKEWLHKCSSIRRLNFNPNPKIKENLNTAVRKCYLPIRLDKLKIENRELYDLLSTVKKIDDISSGRMQ